jgi:hypothetical protein
MKLSEAILLGSTVLTPEAGGLHFAKNQSGCALGMAAIARGGSFRPATHLPPQKDRRTMGTEGLWGDWVLQIVARPCTCWRFRVPREMRIKDTIAHIFDYHVMTKKNWTIDRLAAWVQTVEPKNDPLGTIEPDLVRMSNLQAMRQCQTVNESREEEDRQAVDEWQERVSAFTAKHNSGRRNKRSIL